MKRAFAAAAGYVRLFGARGACLRARIWRHHAFSLNLERARRDRAKRLSGLRGRTSVM